ncbi:hypothetical protein N7445_000858 [Penicillium cf. griseofulvum]|nr:hypothetical protein N7445_000858 [Penicillium cf. griseofulvum]
MDNSLLSLHPPYKTVTESVVDWLVLTIGHERFHWIHAQPSTTTAEQSRTRFASLDTNTSLRDFVWDI